MKRVHSFVARRSQQGVGLVEVMVAVLVLAVGLLGIAAMQAVTLKNTMGSASRSQAAIQIYSMMGIIRADRANLGSYNTNIFTAGDGPGNPGTMAGWLNGLSTTVAPGALGRVVCNANAMECTIGVQWTDANTTGGSSEPVELNITSQL